MSDAQKRSAAALAGDLSRISHRVGVEMRGFGADPGVRGISHRLEDETGRVQAHLERAEWETARRRLRRITSYCISCHTLRPGPAKPLPALDALPEFASLPPSEKGEILASVREFERAVIQFEYALVDRDWARRRPEDWARAVQKLLAIAVRVKNDPSLSLELVSRFADAASYPDLLRQPARVWRKDIKAWRLEAARTPDDSRSRDRKLAHAVKIIEERVLEASGRAGLVSALRASSILNGLLWTKGGEDGNLHSDTAKTAYYAGVAAERLAEMNFWTPAEDYFLLCEESGAGTPWRARCAAKRAELDGSLSPPESR